MSKMLSQLVGVPEQLFALSTQQLERSSGGPSIDVRLTAEIIGKVHMHVKALGLDPDDTTGEELYQALLSLVQLHDRFLVRRLGGHNPGDVADLLPRIKHFVETINVPKNVWVLKHSVAKRLIKATPPKKVMKQLGYRSVDSMLKRESVDELMLGIRLVESSDWQKSFVAKYKKLEPSDFESRDLELVLLDGKKWGNIIDVYTKKRRHNVVHLKELGTIGLLPLPIQHLEGITIVLLPTILHYLSEIRAYSTYFKMQQVHSNFGHVFMDTILRDPGRHAVLAGQHIHWRVIHRYYGKDNQVHPDFFEPHVQPDDLFWRKAEEILYKVEPALHFWHDMDFVGQIHDGSPVSFNLMDMAINYVNRIPYQERAVGHMKDGIWNELFLRYLGTDVLRHQVLKQLDNQIVDSSEISAPSYAL